MYNFNSFRLESQVNVQYMLLNMHVINYCTFQVFRKKYDKVYWYHDRNSSRLLSKKAHKVTTFMKLPIICTFLDYQLLICFHWEL